MSRFKKTCIAFLFILLSFIVVQYVVNINFQSYKIEITENNPNYDYLNDKDYWEYIITSKKYDVNYDMTADIFDTMKIEDGYVIISGKNLSYEDANRFLRALVNNEISSDSEMFTVQYSTVTVYIISPIYIIVILTIELIVLLIIYILKKNTIQIFTINYWKSSRNEMSNIRKLCMISLIFTMQVVAGLIPIPSGFANLGIGLSYIFQAINCFMFGPFVGLIIGCAGDLIGYAISPSAYGFFFPYTINAMLACLMYGLCFYKTKITFVKVLISRLFINLFVNVFLGSIWWGIVVGLTIEQSLKYAIFLSLPKNIIYLLPQSLMLYLVFKYVVKLLYKYNYIEEYQTNISIV